MRRTIGWLAALTGCGPGLADPVPLLDLPDAVQATLLPGIRTSVTVPVRNIGTAEAFVQAEASGDANLEALSFRLGPGEETQLQVSMTAEGYEPVEGALEFVLRGQADTVLLSGMVPSDVDGDGADAMEVGGSDCDDSDPEVSPDAAERCNDADDDCDGQIDEELPLASYWPDDDADGHGAGDPVEACARPVGHADDGDDCDDADPEVSPSAEEIWYDGFDQDCDGWSDDDQDFDGFDAEVAGGTDCDDLLDTVFPGAAELADQLDNDCDTFRDEDVIAAGDLVITELFTDPVTGTPGQAEWLELHNASSTHADLAQVELTVAGVTEPLAGAPLVLPPSGMWLVCTATDPLVNGGIADCGGTHTGLTTGARTFELDGPMGLVDAVDATGWVLQAGRSLELASGQLDADANDDEASWCIAVSLFGDATGDRGTPGVLLPPCP